MDRWARAARVMEQYEETCSSILESKDGRYDGHEIRYHILEFCRDCLNYADEIGMDKDTETVTPHQMVVFARKYINLIELIEENDGKLYGIIKALRVLCIIDFTEEVILRWVYDMFEHLTCTYNGPDNLADQVPASGATYLTPSGQLA